MLKWIADNLIGGDEATGHHNQDGSQISRERRGGQRNPAGPAGR